MANTTSSMVIAIGFMKKNLVLQKHTNGVKRATTLLIIILIKQQYQNIILLFMTNYIQQIINSNIQKQAKKTQLLTSIFII